MHKLLIITGPTGVGKTKFAVTVARKFNGELISADSRQVYKGMDIVTGKDTDEISKSGIRVWLCDLIDPDEPFSVSLWHQAAVSAIADISGRGKLPIVVGGTGLYIRSLLENLETINIPVNFQLRHVLSNMSVSDLFVQLRHINPIKANSLNNSDRNNSRRLIRAIEIAGNSSNRTHIANSPNYLTLTLTLIAPIETLKQRISERVTRRISNGAVLELNRLITKYSSTLPSFTACGYQSLIKSPVPKTGLLPK